MTGREVFSKVCATCHLGGMSGAPRVTQRNAWKRRIAQGIDVMVLHAINGFNGSAGTMPPRGNAGYLTDEEVRAAVEYIVGRVTGAQDSTPKR